MQNIDNSLDKFERHLDEMVSKVQNCQNEKKLKSCSACEYYINCELRQNYIKSVYNSMSKGETGGFEF